MCPSPGSTRETIDPDAETGSIRGHVIGDDTAMSDDATSLTRTMIKSNRILREGHAHTDDVTVVPYVLVTVGCLLVMFVIVGIASFCVAVVS